MAFVVSGCGPAADRNGDKGSAGRSGSPGEPVAGRTEEIPSNGEVCDGRDNDRNGKIDDADVEGDGVCDCLRIASIGRGGAFSNGELVFSEWPNARAQHHVAELADRELSDALLEPFDVLIVLNVATAKATDDDTPRREFSEAEVAAFERWVRAGGGVITTSGYCPDQAAEVQNVNRLLAPFGLAYSATKVGLDGMIGNWMPHPVTEGVQRVFTEVGAEPDGTSAQTLALDDNGHVALQVSNTSDARILVWGDEWITYASQWQAQTDQQVERFWLNALGWVSAPTTCQRSIAAD